MGQHRLVRRAPARAAALQQAGLEPAARLVRPLQIQVGRPAAVAPVLQRKGVGRAGVEPDVQDILDLLERRRVAIGAQELGWVTGEPGVRALRLDRRCDARVHGGIAQRLAGGDLHEHGQRRAPGPLARDQPVRPALHHGAAAGAAGFWIEGGLRDGVERELAQGLLSPPLRGRRDRRVHPDEPLRRVAVDHRGLGPPGVGIAVLQPVAGEQVPRGDQLVHHRAVGRAELARLLAFGLDHLQAGEQGDAVVIGAVGVHRIGDVAPAGLQPD